MFVRCALLSLLIYSLPLHAGSIIKCRAADGSITFADTRCPDGQAQLSKKSYQTRRLHKQTSQKNLAKGPEFPAEENPPPIPRMLFQSKFAQVLTSLQSVKLGVIEYYMYRGSWPASLQDLGFDTREMTSSLIDNTAISEEGRISVQLNSELGEKKEVWLYPSLVMGGTQIEWSCYTNFPADLLQGAAGNSLCQSRYF